jgi:hypothetical protein
MGALALITLDRHRSRGVMPLERQDPTRIRQVIEGVIVVKRAIG